jgi:hypothetical protein
MLWLIHLLRKWFPKHESMTGLHPALEPWTVIVAVKDDAGRTNFYYEEFIYDDCYDTSDIMFGDEHWWPARVRAIHYADRVRKEGYVLKHENAEETHIPVHRIYRIEAVKDDGTAGVFIR